MLLGIFFVFCTIAFSVYFIMPLVYEKVLAYNERRTQELTNRMERLMPRKNIKTMATFYMLAPVGLAILGYLFFSTELKMAGVLVGIVMGFILPGVYTKMLMARRIAKFNSQLIDSLMIMSSSFRGGLSLVQAIEAVVEEMTDPIAQEFAIVLGENKMGVTLDEALHHLYNRVPSSGLQQMITAILLARETGGNLPVIFNRIVHGIREHNKIQQNLQSLTIQGKIQGVVMSGLPFVFIMLVHPTNPAFFEAMFRSDVGRSAMIAAGILWVIGVAMIARICTLKEY